MTFRKDDGSRADAVANHCRPGRDRIAVVIADDHPIVLAGLQTLLRREPDLDVVAQCTDGLEAVRAVTKHHPDVLVLDLRMPRLDGLGAVRQLEAAGATTRIVLLAAVIDDESLRAVLRLGVRGIVLKETAPKSLVDCIRVVYGGGQWIDQRMMCSALARLAASSTAHEEPGAILSPREKEVVHGVVQGLRNAEIAARLAIAESTVKLHLHTVYSKFRVQSRTALMARLRDTALNITVTLLSSWSVWEPTLWRV